ncbi:putative ribonuclease H-like domain-containing protein [Tanacetum coccineum]
MNQDISRKTVNVEETSSKAMLAIDGASFNWSYMADDEVPTNMILMAFSDSEVHNDKTCSKTYLKSFETLKTQLDDLRIEFNKSEFNLANYKRGLAYVEEQLVFYKKNEVIFCEQLVVLKRDISYKDSEISIIKSELEKLKQEKESNQLKIENFDNASKSLDKLIRNQIPDKSRKGMGFVSYNVVPPPPTGLFSPPNLDLSNSGLEEFQQSEFEGYGPKTSKNVSEDTSNEVRESPDAPMVEKLVLDDKLEKKTVFPTIAKIEFLADESQVLLKVPKKNNMYSVDIKNIIPRETLTCLVAKATLDESMFWHRRLGHDETSGIFKSFITEIKNLVDKKVKIIRCDNGIEFKNRVMSDFYEKKDIKREFSVARTPQQNSVAERRNRTLIKAARIMLADSKLPTTFWAEVVNTACYVQNRVLVVKPHNKNPYELFRGKFNGKSDEGFFVRYSLNSKAFRVYNIRTRKVEENLHIRFLDDKLIIVGDGPKWLFDINVLTKSMNYVLVVAGTNFNDSVGIEESFGTGHSSKEKGSSQDYILMPLDARKKDDEGVSQESGIDDQERLKNSTQDVNTDGPSINMASTNVNTGSLNINIVSLTVTTAPLQATHANFFGDETELDMSNITTTCIVPSTPNTRIHKDHSLDHVIGDVQSSVQTRKMTKTSNEQGFISVVYEGKTHEDLHTCLFACFQSQVELKKVIQALTVPSWIETMQDKLLQFKLQKVLTLVDLPYGKRAIGTKWVYKNKKDERVARIEAIRLFLAYASFKDFVVYQMDVKSAFLYGKIEEEVYVCQPPGFEDPEFPNRVYKVEKALYGLHQAPRAWYKTLSTYLLDNGFQRGQIDKTFFIKRVKGDILLVQVYVDDIIFGSTRNEMCTEFEKMMLKKVWFFNYEDNKYTYGDFKAMLKDVEAGDLDVHLYRSMIGSLMYLTASRPDIMFVVYACARFQVTPKVSHLHVVKRLFRYLKGQPKLGLWYPKDSPFELEAYTNSDYAGASLDKKSTTGGCQFLRSILISWQYKKQTIVANFTTKAEYVAAASCCGQVNWIQNQMLDYGYNFINTKLFIDNESTICLVKNPMFHSKTKHIEIRHHFIRDSNEKELIQMIKIHTDQNVADLLTKAFDVGRFQYLIATEYAQMMLEIAADDAIQVSTVGLTYYCTLDNGEMEITAIIKGKIKIVTEASIMRHLKLEDSDGISNFPTTKIFEQLALMGSTKNTDLGQSLAITTAIICLATNRKFNFSNLIFDDMVKDPPSPDDVPDHTPTGAPSTSQPYFSPTLRSSIRQETEVPHPSSSPYTNVADEVASTCMDVKYGGAATTVTGLEAGQGSGNIDTMPHDSPLPRVHTLGSDEGRMQHNNEIDGFGYKILIKKVKRLEKKDKLSKLRRKLRLVLSDEEDEGITLVLMGVSTASTYFTTANVPVTTSGAEISTTSHEVKTAGDSVDDIAAESLMYIRQSATKIKDKGKGLMEEFESAMTKTKRQQEQERLGSYTLQQLRGYSFDEIKSLFKATMKRKNTFTSMESDVDRTVPKIATRSTKRVAKEGLGQQSSKKQKSDELKSIDDHSSRTRDEY